MQANPNNSIPYDRETMALMIAQLNHCYEECSVYFSIVGAPELGLSSFPAPPRNVFMFFHKEGIWSVACVDRVKNQLGMFSGVGNPQDHTTVEQASSCPP